MRTDQEWRLFQQLKDREFAHTKVYDNALLNETGMIGEFGAAFDAIDWGNFWHAWEEGSKFLTLEFLLTLSADRSGVKFRLFNEEHDLTWEQLSVALVFNSNCLLEWSKHKGMKTFSMESFWKKISRRGLNPAPRINLIHNLTLRFLHQLISGMIAPRVEFRTVRMDELQCLFAIINKIKLAPIISMVEHWRTMATRTGKIEITSLVTRIATYLGMLVGAQVTYFDTPRETFDEEHFVQARLLKRVKGELVMIYPHSSTTIVLPCQELGLYQVKRFTLNLASEDDEETIRPSRHSISGSGPATRSRTSRSDRNLIPESTTQQGPASGGTGPSSSHKQQPQSSGSHPPVPLSAPVLHTLSQPALGANQPMARPILKATRTGTMRSSMASSTRASSTLIITFVVSMHVPR
jgi:hypothetical protein